MESKKINQLATNVAPQTSDLTIIGDPITGVSKKITLLQIANLFATTGTVTSVAVTETGDALTITGSPITSAGTINIGFAGDATQYVRGDGALADFPTSTGGGSSVSYYLNSSVSQGTIGGVAYRELSKDPISGAGTDITISANGYVASYITDANDPALLEVPGGNFNCEFYFSVNSNNHNPSFYAELYKYDGSTFTLLGSSQSVPEYLSNGTTLSPYYFAIPVATAVLSVTDRLAIRIYVNVDGRVVTLHTENNHLCQVVTTFSKGLTSLNNLTRQVQFFGTGTSGTDFAISSSTATHTFNLPVASATNTGKLSSTDWSTFNAKQPAGNYVTLDTTQTITGDKVYSGVNTFDTYQTRFNAGIAINQTLSGGAVSSHTVIGANVNGLNVNFPAGGYNSLNFASTSVGNTYTFPNATGTIALTSDLSGYLPLAGGTMTGQIVLKEGTNSSDFTKGLRFPNDPYGGVGDIAGLRLYNSTGENMVLELYTGNDGAADVINFATGVGGAANNDTVTINGNKIWNLGNLPSPQSAITLTTTGTSGAATFTSNTLNIPDYGSALSGYLPLSGGTLSGVLNGTSATFSGNMAIGSSTTALSPLQVVATGTIVRLGEQSGTTGKQFLIGIDATSGRTELQSVWQGTSFTSLALQPSGGNVLIGTTTDNGARLEIKGGFTAFQYNSAGAYPSYNTYFGAIGTNFSNGGSELDIWNTVGGGFVFRKQTGASAETALLTIASTGAATFSGSLLTLGTIGTTPTIKAGGANTDLQIEAVGSGGFLNFVTNGSSKLIILPSGNVGIGTTTFSFVAAGRRNLAINGDTDALLELQNAGSISAYLFSNSTNLEINAVGSRFMQFVTNSAERMRITSGGYAKFTNNGTYLYPTNNFFSVDQNTADWCQVNSNRVTSGTPLGIIVLYTALSPNSTGAPFIDCTDSVGQRFGVRSNGGIANYQANDVNLSDERTKKDIEPLESYWNKFKAIEIVKFKYKDQTHDDFNIGVIAQQVEKIAPEFVDVDGWDTKPKLNKDDNEIVSNEEPLKSIYTADLHHATIKVLQEAMAKIENQQAQIEELKAKIK